jgi:hypothetical protein
VALSGNIIHEVIDNDAITKLNNRSQQIIIWVVSLSAISISIFSIVLFPLELFLFTPALIIPLGVIYMARSKERLPQNATSIKDIGIITGNLLLAFVVIILF